MKRYFDAKLGMYKAVKALLSANAATITAASVPILNTYKNDLNDQIDVISEKSEDATVSSVGTTLTKREARFAAIKSAVVIAGAMYSYAVDTNDTEFSTEMKGINPSFLKAKKDEEVLDFLNNIHTKASDLVTVTAPAINPLADYGVSTADVTALAGLITSYTGLTTAPRNRIVERKTNNALLRDQYKVTDELLIKLDKVMNGLQDSYPEFYLGYLGARELIGPITLSTRIAGTVSKITDVTLLTTEAVEGAKVTVIGLPYVTNKDDQTVQIVPESKIVTTNEKGEFSVPTPDTNTTYTVMCDVQGYADQQITDRRVRRGKKTTVDFLMEPQAGS